MRRNVAGADSDREQKSRLRVPRRSRTKWRYFRWWQYGSAKRGPPKSTRLYVRGASLAPRWRCVWPYECGSAGCSRSFRPVSSRGSPTSVGRGAASPANEFGHDSRPLAQQVPGDCTQARKVDQHVCAWQRPCLSSCPRGRAEDQRDHVYARRRV